MKAYGFVRQNAEEEDDHHVFHHENFLPQNKDRLSQIERRKNTKRRAHNAVAVKQDDPHRACKDAALQTLLAVVQLRKSLESNRSYFNSVVSSTR